MLPVGRDPEEAEPPAPLPPPLPHRFWFWGLERDPPELFPTEELLWEVPAECPAKSAWPASILASLSALSSSKRRKEHAVRKVWDGDLPATMGFT